MPSTRRSASAPPSNTNASGKSSDTRNGKSKESRKTTTELPVPVRSGCPNGCKFRTRMQEIHPARATRVSDCDKKDADFFCPMSQYPWCRNGIYTRYPDQYKRSKWCVELVWNYWRRTHHNVYVEGEGPYDFPGFPCNTRRAGL
ncbi:hypothetical protein M011DRAFT_16688 [Sporormia fimetaria CBS 119925]|uniref:Uncharacterized protein n=1 Tax=Sporormia fimetaria CBS 119925 TaxID=1340428 RepID=A0A6A6VNB5_9PLEO|nr:hypothetical protein M011DRAFT_16688 [Sporormia fimetaria CBS 119925]